jgi:hypothetical protein
VHSSRASIRTLGESAHGFGACWCPMTRKGRCSLKNGLWGQDLGRSRRNSSRRNTS